MSIFNFNIAKRISQWHTCKYAIRDSRNVIYGFLLLEASISICLLMVYSSVVALWYGQMAYTHKMLIKRAQAMQLASNFIERIRADKKLPYEHKLMSGDYIIQWYTEHADNQPTAYLTVQVSWSPVAPKNTVILTTEVLIA